MLALYLQNKSPKYAVWCTFRVVMCDNIIF